MKCRHDAIQSYIAARRYGEHWVALRQIVQCLSAQVLLVPPHLPELGADICGDRHAWHSDWLRAPCCDHAGRTTVAEDSDATIWTRQFSSAHTLLHARSFQSSCTTIVPLSSSFQKGSFADTSSPSCAYVLHITSAC